MGKFKDLWDGEHRSFVRYAVFLTAAFLIYIAFLSPQNLVRWAHNAIELRQNKRQIEYYKKEIEKMDAKILTLSSNRDSLEKYARENFHFARPDDDVYIVEK